MSSSYKGGFLRDDTTGALVLSADASGLATSASDAQVPHASGGRLIFRDPAEYDVRDFGVTGGSDDTTAVQAVIDAASSAGGGTLVFARLTVTVSTLTPKSNVSYVCRNGGRLQHKTGTTNPMFYRPSFSAGSLTNVAWLNMRMTGEAGALTENARIGIYLRSSVSDVRVTGCTFDHFPSSAVFIDALRVHVDGNTATNCSTLAGGRNAINIVADTSQGTTAGAFGEVVVSGNVVDTTAGAGIALVTIGTGLYIRGTVTGNTIRSASGFAGIVCEANGSGHQVAITGNNIGRSICGIEVANTGGTSPQPADHQVFTVSGNTIDCEDLTGAKGLQITSSYTTVDGNTVRASDAGVVMGGIDSTHRAQGQVFSDNTIIGCYTGVVGSRPYLITGNYHDDTSISDNRFIVESGAAARGVTLGDTNRLAFVDNRITTVTRDGVLLTGGAVDATINGNTIFDVNGDASTFSGITIAGAAGNTSLAGNVIIDRRGTPLMKYAIDVSGVTSGVVRVLEGNLGLGWVTGSINGRANVTVDRGVWDTKGSAYWDDFNGQPGIIAPSSRGWSLNTVALTANRAYLVRFVPKRDMAIVKIGFVVSTASGSDDPCDVGIYDSSSNPVQIVHSGATTGKLNSTGFKEITITTTTLKAGTVYYIAFSAASAATVASATYNGAGHPARMFGASPPNLDGGISSTDAHYPLITPINMTIAASAVALALKES